MLRLYQKITKRTEIRLKENRSFTPTYGGDGMSDLTIFPSIWTWSDRIFDVVPITSLRRGPYYYYVLLELSEMDRKENNQTRVILATAEDTGSHGYVTASFGNANMDKIRELNVYISVKGGGFLSVDKDAKKISLGGKSEAYGVADHGRAAGILRGELPDWIIEVTDD